MGNSDDMLSINNLIDQEIHDGGSGTECPDIDFVYSDTDSDANEMAELYSYTEQNEFQLNFKAFEDFMEAYKYKACWEKLTLSNRKSIVMELLDQLDLSKKELRLKAIRCILYLAQGCFVEVQSDQEQQMWTRKNVFMLYELGTFSALVELISFEMGLIPSNVDELPRVAASFDDTAYLRAILSVLYIITEVIRTEKLSGADEYKHIVESFTNELNQPFGDELISVKLLRMIRLFCAGATHFPMKKVLLLLWKITLIWLGGMDTLRQLKDEFRLKHGLTPTKEDTMDIAKCMRASSPPATASDILDNQNSKRNRPLRRVRTNDIMQEVQENLIKQSSLDEQEQLELEASQPDAEEDPSIDFYRIFEDQTSSSTNISGMTGQNTEFSPVLPMRLVCRLPWTPKVRQKDIDLFLDVVRNKFIGYVLHDDHTSLAGLPQPIHEGFKTLQKHIYVSPADIQTKKEEEITRNPITKSEDELIMSPVEILYQGILPNFIPYVIALLKVLLAAAPTSKAKSESINILADVLPDELPMTVTQSTKLGIDVNRHKEIIVKAASAIILLYLKHFKLNHIYQFEYMSQHLVFGNCVPLVLKFFNQNIMSYIGARNTIPIMDFPACVIGDQPELTSDSLIIGDSAPYSFRNIFSCINLLRILNKLIKWKHSRVMMLVIFKSTPILKRTLKVRHAMMQLYLLKLIKMQAKYLGRQWRKVNMKIVSAIYAKVRHRLNDDWAFGNDLDARPWDYQADECALRISVERFNNRRYRHLLPANRRISVSGGGNTSCGGGGGGTTQNIDSIAADQNSALDLNIMNVLNGDKSQYNSENVELSEEFKQHYELWLQQEVYNTNINWDALFSPVDDKKY